jgi:hypothetical protein
MRSNIVSTRSAPKTLGFLRAPAAEALSRANANGMPEGTRCGGAGAIPSAEAHAAAIHEARVTLRDFPKEIAPAGRGRVTFVFAARRVR